MKKTEYAVFQNWCFVYAEHLQMFECRTKPAMITFWFGLRLERCTSCIAATVFIWLVQPFPNPVNPTQHTRLSKLASPSSGAQRRHEVKVYENEHWENLLLQIFFFFPPRNSFSTALLIVSTINPKDEATACCGTLFIWLKSGYLENKLLRIHCTELLSLHWMHFSDLSERLLSVI